MMYGAPLDLSAPLTKGKCAGSDVAEIGACGQRGLAHLERVAAEIVAVQLNQAVAVEKQAGVLSEGEPHVGAVLPGNHPKAVMLDFVQLYVVRAFRTVGLAI
jgi:hypothetical protein